jgi:hypothetical protein
MTMHEVMVGRRPGRVMEDGGRVCVPTNAKSGEVIGVQLINTFVTDTDSDYVT